MPTVLNKFLYVFCHASFFHINPLSIVILGRRLGCDEETLKTKLQGLLKIEPTPTQLSLYFECHVQSLQVFRWKEVHNFSIRVFPENSLSLHVKTKSVSINKCQVSNNNQCIQPSSPHSICRLINPWSVDNQVILSKREIVIWSSMDDPLGYVLTK